MHRRDSQAFMKVIVALMVAGLSFSPPTPAAQSSPGRRASKEPPASAHKLIAINVKGNERYAARDVIAASGLKLGDTSSEDDFKRTAERLGETGVFSNIVYSYSYSSEGTKLELQVTESDKIVRAVFENFVWFSDKELVDKLHDYVPLFNGYLPVSGNVTDEVADALKALLVQRGSRGQVDYLRAGPDGQAIDSIRFSVSNVEIRVRNVEFPGAAPADLRRLSAAAKKLEGNEYLKSKVSLFADHNLLPVYLQYGYLKARFGEPQAKLVARAAGDHQTENDSSERVEVDVTLPVDAGRQYKVSEVRWTGNKAIPTEKLTPLLQLASGQPANAVQLKSDLESLQKLYKTRGYMTAEVQAVPHFDDADATASYQLSVQEGALYRMGDLEIHGLDSHTTDRMRLAWALHEGEPYDAGYPQRFLKETGGLVSPNIHWGISIHESVNQNDKTVDVELRFTPQGVD
jgi:outer membrane protein insertion porin family